MKFLMNDEHFQDIEKMFYALKKQIQQYSKDESKLGMAGWSDEERREFSDVIFKIQDGGYTSVLLSKKYGFNVVMGYTIIDGTSFQFYNGNVDDLKEAYEKICQ